MTTFARAVPLRVEGAVELASWENEGGPPPARAEDDERLDWAGFLARFYPDARKHDYVPLAAYVEYRKQALSSSPTRTSETQAERRRQ